MLLYLLDKNFQKIGMLEDYYSSIRNFKFNEIGDFEVQTKLEYNSLPLITGETRYIQWDEDTEIGIVDKIQVKSDTEAGSLLLFSGVSIVNFLTQRIITEQTNFRGTIKEIVNKILNDNFIKPADEKRTISLSAEWDSNTDLQKFEFQATGDNCWDLIQQLLQATSMGVKGCLENGKLVYKFYKSVDRSIEQDINPHVVFSKNYDNLSSTDYFYNVKEAKNVALIAGEGEGKERKTALVGTASGIDRKEVYFDSRNTSSNNGEITPEQYQQMLIEEASLELQKLIPDQSFEGVLIEGLTYHLNKDFFLGDIITVQGELGLTVQAQITGIIESHSTDGLTRIPTFSFFN